MPDVSFKNADGSARNTPRDLDVDNGVDSKTGEVLNPVEEVDVNAFHEVEWAVQSAVQTTLRPQE